MKSFFSVFFISLVFFFRPASKIVVDSVNSDSITNEEIASIIDTLSSDFMESRGFGSAGIEKSAVYIENYLKQNKIKPYFGSYRDSVIVGARMGYNIVGVIEVNETVLKKEFIILSTHYDHIGLSSDKTDSVYNGANDNATGVSAVLNISKSIQEKNSSKRSISVALFSGEEIGLRGSEHFADKLKAKAYDFYCNVNIDMIGSVLTNKHGKVYISGFEKSNMGTLVNQHI